MKDTTMDTHRLIFPEYTMCTQLCQPDVENVMALCLMREKKENKLVLVHCGLQNILNSVNKVSLMSRRFLLELSFPKWSQ